METTAVDLVATGLVQGVAFRWCAHQEAERLGVAGWIRNQADGSVTAHVEGPAPSVESFVRWCRQGPRWASVERVDVTPAAATGASGFEIRM
jgi:acylphosphatase